MKRNCSKTLGLVLLGGWLACAVPATADTIYVDALCGDDGWSGLTPVCGDVDMGPKRTIQAAIVEAGSFDEVVVARGTYDETIDFLGKRITVRSEEGPELTIIDAKGGGSVVTFASGEEPESILIGFTLTGGSGTDRGGGVFAGGGVYCADSRSTIVDCVFTGNTGLDTGGGMYCHDRFPTVINCVFTGNSATAGGGIYVNDDAVYVVNCTFAGNSATSGGGGIFIFHTAAPDITNCIVWGNTPDQVFDLGLMADVDYCDIEGGYPSGNGNIDTDPHFLDPAAGDFRLDTGSPCIDAGWDNALQVPPYMVLTDCDGNDRFFDIIHAGEDVDMGAYERGYITNLRTHRTSTSFPLAFAAAQNDDELRAEDRAFSEETEIDYAGRAVIVRSTGEIDQFAGSDLVMADDSTLATDGGLVMTLGGELDIPAGARATLEAGEVIVDTTGAATLQPASVLEVAASGGFTSRGGLTLYGGVVIADDGMTVTATGTMTGYGDFVAPVTVAGSATWLADVQVVGSYTTSGATAVQGGTLTVIGPLTATGSLLGGVNGGGPAAVETVVAVFGDLDASTGATVRMPGPGQRVTVAGDWDVAIDDNTHYDMAEAELWMNALAGGQTFELMSLDQSNTSLGLDRFLPGSYPVGTVRIGPGTTTVDLVDVHDNDGLGQASCEALYVKDLIIDENATLNTNGCKVYYRTLVFLGSVDAPANLVEIEDSPIIECPGDTNGDDAVDVNDLNNVILDWGTDGSAHGGDVTGDNDVNVDDLVDVIVFWGPCEPG